MPQSEPGRNSLHLIGLDIPEAFDLPEAITVHAAWEWLLRQDQAA